MRPVSFLFLLFLIESIFREIRCGPWLKCVYPSTVVFDRIQMDACMPINMFGGLDSIMHICWGKTPSSHHTCQRGAFLVGGVVVRRRPLLPFFSVLIACGLCPLWYLIHHVVSSPPRHTHRTDGRTEASHRREIVIFSLLVAKMLPPLHYFTSTIAQDSSEAIRLSLS